MSLPTPVTIYSGTGDLNYLPPQVDSYDRDGSWSFYRGGIRWVCLRQRYNDPTNSWTYAPAMFMSLDNGATWSGPIDDAGAPHYFRDPAAFLDPTDLTAINGTDALIWNFDIRFGAGLDPEEVDQITVLIQAGTLINGPSGGEFVFEYCDFNLDTFLWGSPYGSFHRYANLLYHRAYSSQPQVPPAVVAPVSAIPVFWSSDATPVAIIEGAATVLGPTGTGVANGVVAFDAKLYVVGDYRTAGLPTPVIAPDATDQYTSDARIIRGAVVVASAAGGVGLRVYYLDTFPYTGIWQSDPSPDPSPTLFSKNPWVIDSGGEIHVYWLGPDNQSIWRSILRGTWSVPDLVASVPNVTLGPNVCNNPVLGGVDVTVQVGSFDVVTFHLDAVGSVTPSAANRYYGTV
jgi:hypothetical protein